MDPKVKKEMKEKGERTALQDPEATQENLAYKESLDKWVKREIEERMEPMAKWGPQVKLAQKATQEYLGRLATKVSSS